MSDDHNVHDDLMTRIADAFDDLPPLPEHLLVAAHDVFAWRRVDAELAELLYDSAASELVGVRGAASGRRAFRFGAGDFVIRAHLTDATLVVMIEPPLSVTCRVATASGVTDHRTDELGELAVDAPELPMRLEVELPGGTTVTPWITG